MNMAPTQLLSPALFLQLKINAVTPPIRAAMPTSNRKTSSAKTPLLPLVISKAVTKSETLRIILPSRPLYARQHHLALSANYGGGSGGGLIGVGVALGVGGCPIPGRSFSSS